MASIKRPKQLYDLIEVWWSDASEMESGWATDLEKPAHAMALSVGFLLMDDKDHLVIALDTDEEGAHNGRSQIPRGMVKKIKILRKADNAKR